MFDKETWQFFDLIDEKQKSCPNCGKEDVMFYLSNPIITGFKFSAQCKRRSCGYKEESLRPDFVEGWVID